MIKSKSDSKYKNQEEMKNTISKIKNALEGIMSRLAEAGDWISGLEDKVEGNTQVEQQHEKRLKKYEGSLRELQDNMKQQHSNYRNNRRRRKGERDRKPAW